jgi:hypothetical protein
MPAPHALTVGSYLVTHARNPVTHPLRDEASPHRRRNPQNYPTYQRNMFCHPERSEGSASLIRVQITSREAS